MNNIRIGSIVTTIDTYEKGAIFKVIGIGDHKNSTNNNVHLECIKSYEYPAKINEYAKVGQTFVSTQSKIKYYYFYLFSKL